MPRVLAISGSARTGSFNTSLLNVAINMLEDKGAEVATFDFRKHPLPIYDADMERDEGYDENILMLKRAVHEAVAVVFAGPEYNAGPTPLLKNAIDWVSRRHHGESNEWDGKLCVLMSASPSTFGGVRAQAVYRAALAHCHAIVLPDTVTVPNASEAFGEDGALLNQRAHDAMESMVARLLEVSSRLRAT